MKVKGTKPMNTRNRLLVSVALLLVTVQTIVAQWTQVNVPLGPSITAMTATSDSGIFALRNDSTFYFVGSSTTSIVGHLREISIDCFAVVGSSVYYGSGGVYRMTHTASGWQTTLMSGSVATYPPTALAAMGTTLFAGTYVDLYRSSDEGHTWVAAGTGLPQGEITALAVNGSRLFAGTGKSGIYYSTNNGGSWTMANTGLSTLAVASIAVGPGTVDGTIIYAGTSQGIFISTNNGSSWSPATNGLPLANGAHLRYPKFANIGSTMFVVADSLGIFKTTNNGASWVYASETLPGANVLNLAVTGSRLYAGTGECGLYWSDDFGTTWTRKDLEYSEYITEATFGAGIDMGAGGNGAIYIGTDRGICRSTDNGLTWKVSSKGIPRVLLGGAADYGAASIIRASAQTFAFTTATDGSGSRTVFAGTDIGGILVSRDGGLTWQSANKGLPYTPSSDIASISNWYDTVSVLSSNGPVVWAGLQAGRVYQSTDNGMSWVATNTGIPAAIVTGIAFPSSIDQIQPGVLVATRGGGVYRTTDNGLSWISTNRGLSNLSLTGLSVAGSKIIATATHGEVFVSSDGGSSWTKTSPFGGNPLLRGNTFSLASSGSNVFVTTTTKTLWFTADYGLNWLDITGSLQTRYIDDVQLVVSGTDLWAVHVATTFGSIGRRAIDIARRPLSGIVAAGSAIAATISQIDASAFPQVKALVTVTDSSKHPIAGLSSANFSVTEDGIVENLLSVTAAGSSGSPVTLVIAVDKGETMTSSMLTRAKSYATTLIQMLHEEDSAAVMAFDNATALSTPFTPNQGLLIESIRGITGSKVSAIFDALFASVGQLKPHTGSKAIVLFSAGIDQVSRHSDRDALDLLAGEGIPVYVIGFPTGSLGEETLVRIAKSSDGAYYVEPGTEGIAGIYHVISTALKNQYRITYTSHNAAADGSTRNVGITTSYNNSSALKQRDYVAPLNTKAPSINPYAATIVPAGLPFWVDVKVGDPNMVKDLYGISFKLRSSVPTSTYVAGSATAGSFLGTGPLTFFQSPDAQTVSGTVTKTSAPGIDGSGTVARFQFTTPSSLAAAVSITFTLSDVQANNSSGVTIPMSPGTLTLSASPSATVWPGDCDNNGGVTAADVLPIGLYYGQKNGTTSVANNPGIQWQTYKRAFWLGDSLGRKVYADADGNGVIDGADVLAVGLNYNKAATKAGSNVLGKIASGQQADGSLDIGSVVRSAESRRRLLVPLLLNTTAPVYGIAFTVTTGGSATIVAVDTTLNPLSNPLMLSNISVDKSGVEVGLTSTRGRGFVGRGKLLTVQLEPGSDPASPVHCDIVNVTANDANGAPLTITGKSYRGIVSEVGLETLVPTEYGLSQNFPNPFNPTTNFELRIANCGFVSLKIIDVLGRVVATLVHEERPAGVYIEHWDASTLPSGVYYYKMTVTEQSGHMFTQTRRMMLVK
jgi:VWFA-related protein